MTAEHIQAMIAAGLACQHLEVSGDGRHWQAVVVAEQFEGLRLIARHQKVYATLGNKMHNDEVHALSMKTLRPPSGPKRRLKLRKARKNSPSALLKTHPN